MLRLAQRKLDSSVDYLLTFDSKFCAPSDSPRSSSLVAMATK